MAEYVPIEVDDVVYVSERAMLVRMYRERVKIFNGEIDIFEYDFEQWIPLEYVQMEGKDFIGPCAINVDCWFAQFEGLI